MFLRYWDWSVDGSRLPTVLTQSTIGVTRPSSSGSPASATITNPFFAYRFTSRILRDQNIDGDQEGDTAATLRWPNSRGVSQNNRATSAMAAGYRNRRTNTYQLFMIPTFRGFTNNVFVADESPETWTSVEAVHGEVHVSIGGEGGHMLAIGYSAFDPVFWLHHANVDRLIALYQV